MEVKNKVVEVEDKVYGRRRYAVEEEVENMMVAREMEKKGR